MKDTLITLILFLFGVGIGYSQQRRSEICVDFRLNSMVIDPSYSDNAARMQELVEFLRSLRQDSTTRIVEVFFAVQLLLKVAISLIASWQEDGLRLLKSLFARKCLFPIA